MANKTVTAAEVLTMHLCALLDVYMALRDASKAAQEPQIIRPRFNPPNLGGS